MMVFPGPFLSIFTRDPQLLGEAAPWLQILAMTLFGMSLGMVFSQCLNTAGETLLPMIVVVSSNWLIQQPLAIMLSGARSNWEVLGQTVHLPTLAHWDEFGICWAIVIAQVTRPLTYFPYLKWGPWLKKQVL